MPGGFVLQDRSDKRYSLTGCVSFIVMGTTPDRPCVGVRLSLRADRIPTSPVTSYPRLDSKPRNLMHYPSALAYKNGPQRLNLRI